MLMSFMVLVADCGDDESSVGLSEENQALPIAKLVPLLFILAKCRRRRAANRLAPCARRLYAATN
jgi:hypothetical protein